MKRTIGLLMMVGLLVGVVGCGDDDNPVKSNQELQVGTWTDEARDDWTLKADGTFVDNFEGEGTWSLVGDQLTFTYDDPDLADEGPTVTLNEVDSYTATITENGEREVLTRQS